MYKLSDESFQSVERYVVTKGENYNQDRCIVVPICNSEVTCCMDEIQSEIRICQVNKRNMGCSKGIEYANNIIDLAHKAIYSTAEESKYRDYVEVIKMQTECCGRDCEGCMDMIK